MKKIKLTKGYSTVVDDDTYEYLNQWYWYAYTRKDDSRIYATRSERGKTVWMHREIMGASDDTLVDHRDGNGLNNIRENLREVNKSKNATNRSEKNSNNTSGYRNVTWIGDFWRVQLQVNGKNKLFPEKFIEVEDAGKFAEKMRKKYYGKFAGKDE